MTAAAPVAESATLAADFELILARAAPLWPRLAGKSLFITGCTGFFGRWLLEALRIANTEHRLGLRITVLTRDPEAFGRKAPAILADPAFRFVAGDVRDFAFPAGDFSHVIHAATTSAHETFAGEDPLRKFDTLVGGTRRVLDFAAERGIENLLFTSSGVVYQPPPTGGSHTTIPESSLLAPPTHDPASALGQAKRASEFLCACYAERHGWHLGIARCFSFVGPFLPLDIHYAIGNFIAQALHAERIVVNSDGTALRSYLYAADLVVWLLTLLLEGESGRPCNVGSDAAISIGDLAHRIRDLIAPDKPVDILGKAANAVGNPIRNAYIPDITLARNTLGLDVWTDLSTAIRSTARHAANQMTDEESNQGLRQSIR
jgi:UDP-glucuronate decarboxylase